jgi:hypothetical protein
MGELLTEQAGRGAFETKDNLRRGNPWRSGNEQMEVIRLNSKPEDVELKFRRFGDKKLLKALGNRPKEHFATAPGYPNEVIAQERY